MLTRCNKCQSCLISVIHISGTILWPTLYNHTWLYGSDATVLDDYALTTTTTLYNAKRNTNRQPATII